MGEVYRARDTRLDREVAIKVLPVALARDHDRLARFEREAKVLASLNHPNIAQIYGFEESGETRALAMELVAGSTLSVPQPLETALNYAKQIAEALEAAHEKGFTHRDLKPANIMITPEGVVKVLDFGLAAIPSREADGSDPSNSPTLTMAATMAGTIMGTAAYMSPEQAAGKVVDRRSDIWSFGVVLYEMLAGKRLFDGETLSHTLADVLRAPIDFGKLPSSTPAPIRQLVKRCLERDVKRRLRDIGEARVAIQDYLADPAGGTESPAPVTRAPGNSWWWKVAAGALTLGLAALAFIHFREKPPATPLLRYTVAVPEKSAVHSLAISPDGRLVAVATMIGGKRQLWLRSMDALQWQPLPGTDDARYPFWSPDSRYIAFFAGGKLRRIATGGGPSQALCDAADGWGGTWNREDVIVFSPSGVAFDGVLQRVPAADGVPATVLRPGTRVDFPAFLPDGLHFLYSTARMRAEQNGIYIASLDGKEKRRILADASSAVWVPAASGARSGHILFIRENNLMAQPFDAESLQVSGDVFPIAEGISLNGQFYTPAAGSDTGILLYNKAGSTDSQIAWYDRTGKLLGSVGAPGPVSYPSLSPDEKSVVYLRRTNSGASDLWLRDLARGTETRFTSDPSRNAVPFWSPQGDRVIFASNRSGLYGLYVKNSGGSEPEQLLLKNPNTQFPNQWSRDGRFIVYAEFQKASYNLWVLPMEGPEQDRRPVPFLQTEFSELMGQLSPDSHWMAYTSDQSGRREVYVRPFPPAEGQWTISAAGGEMPRWRGDGKELYFRAADGKLMAVPVTRAVAGPKPAFEAGTPVALFDAHIQPTLLNNATNYDVTADGKRFLITARVGGDTASAPPLTVVVNWNAAAKR